MNDEINWIAAYNTNNNNNTSSSRSFGSFMHGLLDTAANIIEKPITNVVNDIGHVVGLNALGDDVVKPVVDEVHNAITGGGGAIGEDLKTSKSSAAAPDNETMTGRSTFAGAAGGEDQIRGITNFGGESVLTSSEAVVEKPGVATESIESLRDFFKRPRRVDLPLSTGFGVLNFNDYFGSTPISSKLTQYAGARFTLCMRIHSNYAPDSSGWFAYNLLPLKTPPIGLAGSSNAQRIGVISNAPHAIHNMNEVDSTELRLPYCHPMRFLDTASLIIDSADYFKSVYSFRFYNPADVLGLYMYVWLEDLDLFYPTSASSVNPKYKWCVPSFPVRNLPIAEGPEHHSHVSESQLVQVANYIDDVAHAPGPTKPQSVTSLTRRVLSPHSDSWYDYFKTMTCFYYEAVSVGATYRDKIPVGLFRREFDRPNMMQTKLSVAGMLFKYWRGSINYKFTMYKSKFHNGRLQFGFLPHVSPNEVADGYEADEDLWGNIYSEIWNIRDSSTFEFSCPYRLSEYFAHREGVSGTLLIRSVSPISAPDTVSPDMWMVGYIGAGDDFQVARYLPFTNSLYGNVSYLYAAGSYGGSPTAPTKVPVAEGLASSQEEKFPIYLNDGDITISQSAAVPFGKGYVVDGFDIETEDHDIWSSEVYQPCYRFGIATNEVDQDKYAAANMNFSALINSLFLGSLTDPYFKLQNDQDISHPYGTGITGSNYCYPYTCNLSYLPKAITEGVMVNGTQINNRPIKNAVLSSLLNAQFCFPFVPPPSIIIE